MTRRTRVLAATAGAALAAGVGGAVVLLRAEGTPRRDQVAERGRLVMPFDLDETTHFFRADARGGVQRVLADDPTDRRTVRLIRAHLRHEAAAFGRGDFDDPAAIHGRDMPGLAALRAGHRRIDVGYRAVSAGAQITYRTEDRALVDALSAWFAAQLSDHGAHAATGGHAQPR